LLSHLKKQTRYVILALGRRRGIRFWQSVQLRAHDIKAGKTRLVERHENATPKIFSTKHRILDQEIGK
jgi:hypothetical protein